MLERLIIRNLAVIEELDLELDRGLTVLSGETGAGKSIVVDALNLLMGGRASTDLVRSGCDRAYVQGVFTTAQVLPRSILGEHGIDDEGEIIITREIGAARGACRVNGKAVTQSFLKTLGASLVDFHGQHEHQSLLNPVKHQHLIDRYAGNEASDLLDQMLIVVRSYNRCLRELSELCGDERERTRLMDLLVFQLKEIDSAKLKPGEEESLRAERLRLINFEKLSSAVERAYAELYSGGTRGTRALVDALGRIVTELRDLERLAPEVKGITAQLEQAGCIIDDAARELGNFRESLEFEPGRLDSVEQRLDQINKLKRKYGESLEQILLFRREASSSLDRISASGERIGLLEKEKEQLTEKYRSLAARLSLLRRTKGDELVRLAAENLQELGMKNARMALKAHEHGELALNPLGAEQMEFLFSANPGEELKPLSRIASGGEISRVMLALKAVFSKLDDIDTLVFDEVDSGVGGKAAQAVAQKIGEVSHNRQVLCISHLAQIAAEADNHLFVQKRVTDEKTVASVNKLTNEARVKEVARMLSGEESDVALEHAQELLARRHRV